MKKKSTLSSILLLTFLGLYTILNTSYIGGFGSYSNTQCVTCHGTGNPSTTVAINGLPSAYAHGQSYPLSVTVTNPSKIIGGFQIRSNIGTISTSDGGISTYADGRSAGHNSPKAMTGGVATFNVVWTAPTTGSTAANFGAQGIGANASGTASGDAGGFVTISNIPLPVRFLDVSAKHDKDNIQIRFETSDEINIKEFVIERSANNADYETIDVLSPKGGGNYISIDKNAKKGTNYLYRIKEISNDNKPTYSKVVSAQLSTISEISLYPSIVKNNTLYIKDAPADVELSFSLYNFSGKKIESAQNVKDEVHLSTTASGLYIAALTIENRHFFSRKIYIQ